MARISFCGFCWSPEEVDLPRIFFPAIQVLSPVWTPALVIPLSQPALAPRYANARVAKCLRPLSRAISTQRSRGAESNSFVAVRARRLESQVAWAGNAARPESLPVVESLDRAGQSCPTGNRRS